MRFGPNEMNEADFYRMIRKILNEGRITLGEYEVMADFVCAIYDYCDGMGFSLEEEV